MPPVRRPTGHCPRLEGRPLRPDQGGSPVVPCLRSHSSSSARPVPSPKHGRRGLLREVWSTWCGLWTLVCHRWFTFCNKRRRERFGRLQKTRRLSWRSEASANVRSCSRRRPRRDAKAKWASCRQDRRRYHRRRLVTPSSAPHYPIERSRRNPGRGVVRGAATLQGGAHDRRHFHHRRLRSPPKGRRPLRDPYDPSTPAKPQDTRRSYHRNRGPKAVSSDRTRMNLRRRTPSSPVGPDVLSPQDPTGAETSRRPTDGERPETAS